MIETNPEADGFIDATSIVFLPDTRYVLPSCVTKWCLLKSPSCSPPNSGVDCIYTATPRPLDKCVEINACTLFAEWALAACVTSAVTESNLGLLALAISPANSPAEFVAALYASTLASLMAAVPFGTVTIPLACG